MVRYYQARRILSVRLSPRQAWLLGFFLLAASVRIEPAHGQDGSFNASWYRPGQPYAKIAVIEDGVYSVTGAQLNEAGVPTASITPSTLQLYYRGREVPLHYIGNPGFMAPVDRIIFVGLRNQGTDEAWAYQDQPALQSSSYNSLYTDTTHYWLTWGTAPGRRYFEPPPAPSPTFTSSFRDTLHLEPDQLYYPGDDNDSEFPLYTEGEGYYWNRLRNNSAEPITFGGERILTDFSPAADDVVSVAAHLRSITNTRHRVTLDLQTTADGVTDYRSYDEADWHGYAFRTLEAEIPATAVPMASRVRLRFRLTSHNEFNAIPNITYVDWVRVAYTRPLQAENGLLDFSTADAGTRRFEMKGFGLGPVVVFNPRDGHVFTRQPVGGNFFFIDTASGPTTYWAVSTDALRTPALIEPDRPSNWADPINEADYLIVTSAALKPSAEALAGYRSTHNNFQVAVVDVQDIYDQFDYGRPTPIAIRRYLRQTQQWRRAPTFATFWGDALYPDRSRVRPAWEVPSFGVASSDAWFAMQSNGPEDWTEFMALGRLPVRSNEDGLLFVEKLERYEAAPLAEWQTDMIMIVGGQTEGEQRTLQTHMNRWAARAIAPPSGMDTTRFYRTVTAETPLDRSFQDSIRVALRSGSSWLCYFGHSAAVTWDVVVDPPEEFDNAGRLPLAISLGCRTGAFAGGQNVDDNVPVLAEQLVLGTLNGAIAHWGTSTLSSISGSAYLSDELHELVFADTARVLGPLFQEVKRRYAGLGPASVRELVQFGLIGDPATRLSVPVLPDLLVAREDIRIAPLAPLPSDEALTVTVSPRNLGLIPGGPVDLLLTHTAPGGSTTPYTLTVPPDLVEETHVFTVPIDSSLVGTNHFRVQIDAQYAHEEVTDANNTGETTHIVFSTELNLVAPGHLSAITDTPVRLRVAFTPRDADGTAIAFELDEVSTFDSPAKRSFETVTRGSFAIWEITEPLAPGRPYYWRARIHDPEEITRWQESVFFLEQDAAESAWTQRSALFDLNTQDARLRWTGEAWQLNDYDVEVEWASSGTGGLTVGRMVVNGVPHQSITLGQGVLVLDGKTGALRGEGTFRLYQDPDNTEQMRLDSLIDSARPGDYLFVRSRNIGAGEEIEEDTRATFRALGSTAIDTLAYRDLWLLMAQKGFPERTREWAREYSSQMPDLVRDTVLYFQFPSGTTRSPAIGPARRWTDLTWQATLPNADSEVRVDVLDAEADTVLLAVLTASGTADLTFLNAQAVPFLRLRATLTDSSRQSTPQLRQWGVNYTQTPEVVLDPFSLILSADTLAEGEVVTLTGDLLNLSDQAVDTLVVSLHLTDAANRTTLVQADTLTGLVPDGRHTPSYTLDTFGLLGENRLTLEAEQPGLREPLTFNNTGYTSFFVQGDTERPTLTVSLDGETYPADPDPVTDLQDPRIPLVPPRPTFEIVFADSNPFKLLADTTLARLTLDNVGEGTTRRIAFSSPEVAFEPATAERNEALIRYTPDFTGQSAVFTLRVRAFDVEGNEAEGSPYQFHFRVQTNEEFSMGTLYPYPNPMHTFTRFAFELRGADPGIVEDLRIRIYTLSGHMVREFDLVKNPAMLDGGGLRIGWNKLVWDGTDEDGDPLATGVYLYKVFMRAEGEKVEVNNEAGLEKLVILR